MFFRRLAGTSQSKEKKSRRHAQMPSTFDVSEESLEYIHPADLAASKDPLQRSLPSLKRYSRDPSETFASSSSRKLAAYPILQPTIESSKGLPQVPPEPQQDETPDFMEENFMPLQQKEPDPQFPGAFELDPHPTSPAAATAAEPVQALEDAELVLEDAEVKSFVEQTKDEKPEVEEEPVKVAAEEDPPPPVPDKQPEPDPPVADYVEERKPRRPRNPGGFGSFLDNIVDLQAAGKFNPIIIQPVEKSPSPVSPQTGPPSIGITPPTPAPDVPQKSPRLPSIPIDEVSLKNQSSSPLRGSFSRHEPLPTPTKSPPPTPRSIFGVDPGTASRIAELARRRRMEAAGEVYHPKAQSEQSNNPLAASTSSKAGLPSPEADEFGHRRGYTDMNKGSQRRKDAPPIDPPLTHHRPPTKLTKQPSDEPYLPPTPESLPSPSLLIPSPTHADLDREKQAQKVLQDLLDRTMAELNSVKADNERLITRQKREKERLVDAMRLQLDDNGRLTGENKSLNHAILQLKSELKEVNSSFKSLKKEKDGWQAQLDAMQNQVISTDKRIRCLDNVTRQQFEARQNVLGTQIKRRGKMANTSPSAELVTAVKTLNEEILQTSSILVDQMEPGDPYESSSGRPRAQKVLGPQLTDILETKKREYLTGPNVLLLQVVLEVFIVNWCSSIIDAYYPNTKSFSDLLVELSQKPPTSAYTSRASPTCGKYLSVVQSHRTDSSPFNFSEWVKDVISDLTLILSVGGQRVKPAYQNTLSAKFTALVKSAYEIRTAFAEHDICGYLEIVVVTPSAPFQHKWMIEAHSDTRDKSSLIPPAGHADIVLGTCGIGLQQSLPPAASSTSTEPSVVSVLKPQVVLSRVILAPPSA